MRRWLGGCVGIVVLMAAPARAASEYDPLKLQPGAVTTLLRDVEDESRERTIPIKIYLPATEGPAPVVLVSHGLGGSREGSAYLGKHWAGRGYVAVFLQHPGSDDSVWKNERPLQRMQAMRRAASAENFLRRVKDVPAVISALDHWNREEGDALVGRLDLDKIGMSGHSFGAVTTQAVTGESTPIGGAPFTDPRIKAAVIMSPSSPRQGKAEDAFRKVRIPWLLMTGTKDVAPIGGQTVETRLAVYRALPEGSKYELVLDNAEHSAFSERPLPGDRRQRNPNHHRAILAITTAFWDAYLRGDADARAWLDGAGAQGVLEEKDVWKHK